MERWGCLFSGLGLRVRVRGAPGCGGDALWARERDGSAYAHLKVGITFGRLLGLGGAHRWEGAREELLPMSVRTWTERRRAMVIGARDLTASIAAASPPLKWRCVRLRL